MSVRVRPPAPMVMVMKDCIFCKIIRREAPATIMGENDDIIAIKDINPKAPIHFLIIPKKHIKDINSLELDDYKIVPQLIFAAQKMAQDIPEAYNFKFLINNGYSAGQRVFHLHAHFLAGQTFSEL
ncbi:MAG TPA: HIT domain-containing protein [Candidatus Babeliaceae bacterium]|nr:HIT domain-containing protein [Candidatus Babeliaceae bacterium]